MKLRQTMTQSYRALKKYRTPFALANLDLLPRMSADSRGAVYSDLGVFYNRIPKAANTTVVAILHEIQKGTVDEVDAIKEEIIRPSRLDWTQARAFRRLFKFTFVRNPYERLLSAWLQKVAPGKVSTYAGIPGFGNDSQEGFAAFVRYLSAGGLMDNKHWTPQYLLMVIPPEKYDFVGRVETFNRDMQYVLDKAGLVLPDGRSLDELYPTDKAGKKTQAGEKLAKYFSATEIDQVYQLYKTDFERLNYPKDPVW